MTPYEPFVEREMREFYESLPESKRRRYAAIEASKFGHGGGTNYISELLGCSNHTISAGKKELEEERVKKNSGLGAEGEKEGGRKKRT